MEIQVEELLEKKEELNALLSRKESLEAILAEKRRENASLMEKSRLEREDEEATYVKLMKLKTVEVELMSQAAHLDAAQEDSREVLQRLGHTNFLKRCYILSLIRQLEIIY